MTINPSTESSLYGEKAIAEASLICFENPKRDK